MKQYPVGIQDFARIVTGEMYCADKTDLVDQLVSSVGVHFLSRPLWFGKSLLVSTIKCYFEGRKDLFKGLKMEQLERKWEASHVFESDFNGKDYTRADTLEVSQENCVEKMIENGR